MKLLLDTQALIWAALDVRKLSAVARDLIADETNEIRVSAASAWEIATKVRLGKLPEAAALEARFVEEVTGAGYVLLPITTEVALRAARFTSAHRDPFDRILSAQSLDSDVPIISIDAKLDLFGVRRIW